MTSEMGYKEARDAWSRIYRRRNTVTPVPYTLSYPISARLHANARERTQKAGPRLGLVMTIETTHLFFSPYSFKSFRASLLDNPNTLTR